MTLLAAALTAVVALLTLLVAGLLRSHAEILRRLHALERGGGQPVELPIRPGVPRPPEDRPGFVSAADLAGRGLGDDAVSITVRGVRHHTLLAFLSSACATCEGFWRALGARDFALPAGVRLVVVTQGPEHESITALRALAPPGIPLVMSSQAWVDYGVPGSPYFVFVDGAAGRVRGEGTGVSWEQVRRLLAEAIGDAAVLGVAGHTLDLADDARREARIDAELLAAGIHPGHPSLYEPPAAPPSPSRGGNA